MGAARHRAPTGRSGVHSASFLICYMKQQMEVPVPQAMRQRPLVLTRTGRNSLEKKLLDASDRQRQLARRASNEGRRPDDDEYRLALARVAELRSMLDRAVSPTAVEDDPRVVELGDVVTLRHPDGTVEQITLTEPIEATAHDSNVSIESPLGSALSGRQPGDEVEVAAPSGTYSVVIAGRRRAQ